MRKFYEDPSMTVKEFGRENVVTASGETGTPDNTNITEDGITTLGKTYAIKRISAANVVF